MENCCSYHNFFVKKAVENAITKLACQCASEAVSMECDDVEGLCEECEIGIQLEIMKLARARKPEGDGYSEPWLCPYCDNNLSMYIVNGNARPNYCPECGQAIDWTI